MPNSMETVWQQVEEETAHELADLQSHDFVLVIAAFSVVLPAEGHMGLIEIEQAAVGDRDALRVARQIGQDLLGTGEWSFGIDDPLGRTQRRQSSGKHHWLVESNKIGKELQFTGSECCGHSFEEPPPEQGRDHVQR